MAQADEALLRLCRLCVSIKMHTQGMSVADAAKFFHENCYYEEKPSMSEAMRGTFDPGYLNYTLGKWQILKLRDDYKAQEGANFSLEKFHNEILNHGMPPIRCCARSCSRTRASGTRYCRRFACAGAGWPRSHSIGPLLSFCNARSDSSRHWRTGSNSGACKSRAICSTCGNSSISIPRGVAPSSLNFRAVTRTRVSMLPTARL